MSRRVALAALLAAAFGALAGPVVLRASADAGQPPVATNWSPQNVTASGQPLRIVVVGYNLSGVNQVFTSPVLTPRTVAVLSDQAVVVTLPATTAPGQYAIDLSSPSGATQPGSVTISVLAPVPTAKPGSAGGAVPAESLLPAPVATDQTPAGVAAPPAQSEPATSTSSAPAATALTDSPFFALAVGIAIGGLLYALWGKEGRLRVARRRGFLAQLWARPMQRLKLGRICLHCGRLHYVLRTRRDLWRAGQFCSATCFVASQEEELEFASSTGVAPTRLRGVGVYADMETSLQAALRAEAAALSSSLFTAENVPNVPLVPGLGTPPPALQWQAPGAGGGAGAPVHPASPGPATEVTELSA